MAKLSSNKRPARPEKEYAGCMWGIVNLFDFRQGPRTPRLITDKKSGSNKHTGNGYSRISLDSVNGSPQMNDTDIADEGRTEKVNSALASVKTLIEEEMSQDYTEKKISNDNAQQINSETEYEVQHKKKKNVHRSKKSKIILDTRVNNLTSSTGLDAHHSDNSTDSSSLSTDLAAFLVQFYSHGYQLQQMQTDHDNEYEAHSASETTPEMMNNQLNEPDSLLDEKQSIIKKAVADLTQMITNQNFCDEKSINGFNQSNEFLDILNTLNANKESFLKILEHPDSFFLKQFQDFQNGQVGKFSKAESDRYSEKIGLLGTNGSSGKVEEPDGSDHSHKQSRYNFFWKHKSKATMLSQGSPRTQAPSKIVVLKPNPDRIMRSSLIASTSSPQPHLRPRPEGNREKVSPFFSLREMKRRIKNMFGDKKARQAISMDGVLHKIPIGSKDSVETNKLIAQDRISISSVRKSSVDAEVPLEAGTVLNKRDKEINPEEGDLNVVADFSLPVAGGVIYEEGRKHLAEILVSEDQRNSAVTAHVTKPLGRILSLPEYTQLSTRPSLESEQELVLLPKDGKLISLPANYQEDASNNSSSLRKNLDVPSSSSSILHHELQILDLKVELFESNKLDTASISMNSNEEGIRAPDVSEMMVASKLDKTSISNDYHVTNQSEICAEEEFSTQVLVETQTAMLSELAPSSSPAENTSSVSPTGKPGRKSPPSVLEKFYSEDITTPEWTTVKHSRRQLKPRQLAFEDDISPSTLSLLDSERHLKTYFGDEQARLAYIKAVLEASELNNNEHSERWYWADELLEPSLFENVETSCYPLQDDPKLLFDCINEVLSEIQERHFKIGFMNHCVRPAPVGVNLIHEVSKPVDRHLRTVSPNTVDQIMARDMDIGTWMNLHDGIEDIVIDIWDTLLDDLMEEAVFDLWFFDM